jgi:hypothetical protein
VLFVLKYKSCRARLESKYDLLNHYFTSRSDYDIIDKIIFKCRIDWDYVLIDLNDVKSHGFVRKNEKHIVWDFLIEKNLLCIRRNISQLFLNAHKLIVIIE